MTTTLLLIRHGAHDLLGRILAGRMAGVGLNETGKAQAQRLVERLETWSVSAVYASPLQRAQETALPIGRQRGLPVQTSEAFLELDAGGWTGVTFERLHHDPAWARWNAQRGYARCPGGESFVEVQARVAGGLDLLGSRHPDQTIAVVSHGDVIKAAIAHLLGLPLDFHARFEIEPASVSVAAYGDWGAKILKLNEES